MKKPILIYGAISGIIPVVVCIVGLLLTPDDAPISTSVVAGYLVMLLAFCVIFVAVKGYRDKELGGVIRFGQAFALGLGISAVASLTYVVGWEAFMAISDFDFMGRYLEAVIEAEKQKGVSGETLDAFIAKMNRMAESYENPLFRMPITFTEIFPVGLIVSLIAAGVLRKSDVLPDQGV